MASSRTPRVKTSQSFTTNGARPTCKVNRTSANKGTSAANRTASSTHKVPAAQPSQARHLYAVKDQPKAIQQPNAILPDPEVVFLQKDITKFKADVIVCPASPTLITISGISRAVMEKAGFGLKRAFIRKRSEGILPTGHAFVTESFNLSDYRCIIHVVVPKMPENENPSECIRELEKAFDNCFDKLLDVPKRYAGGKGKVETLAIPALGAGTNKIPKGLVAEVMCDGVHKLLGNRKYLAPHLKKIFIVSLDPEMLQLLRKEWDAAIRHTRSRDATAVKSGDDGRGKSSATCYVSSWSADKGSRPLDWQSKDTLVAKGGSSGDRDDKKHLLRGNMNQSKERAYSRSTNDTDSDSDSKQGACGGAYGSKSRKDDSTNDEMGQSRESDSFQVTAGRASGKTGSDSDSGNDAYGSDDGSSPGGKGHGLPRYQFTSRNMADYNKAASINYAINPRRGQGRRSHSADAYSDENDEELTLDKTKAVAIRDIKSCPICFDPIGEKNSESLPMCGHKVCRDCWKQLQLHNPICPVCRKVYGELRGNQPEKARMMVKSDQHVHLPGYERFGTIFIDYTVPDGRQTEGHPNPGKPYKGTYRTAFLPDNLEGNEVLKLLERAFKARLIFTIGRSVTTGTEDVVTWNDIHHKTFVSGPEFGYPDPTYLTRVKEELAAKGIK